MPYLINAEGTGIASMYGYEMELALKAGWKFYDPTKKPVEVVPEPITDTMDIPAAPRRGRPPKGIFGKE